MKIIKLIDGTEYLLQDQEAEHCKKIVMSGQYKFIPLSNGEVINITSIAKIGEPETVAYCFGNPVDKNGMFTNRFGNREEATRDVIERRLHPKYNKLPEVRLLTENKK